MGHILKVERGNTKTFYGKFYKRATIDATPVLTDVDSGSPVINIKKPDGTLVVTNSNMTKESTGIYFYNYTFATTADLGLWSVDVSGTVNGQTVLDREFTEVVDVTV